MTDIENLVRQLLYGGITREDAHEWAYTRMQASDNKTLEFEPADKKDSIWDAIEFLMFIDSEITPGEYLYPMEQIRDEFQAWSDTDGRYGIIRDEQT